MSASTRLYLLHRCGPHSYDESWGAVIRAKSESDARRVYASQTSRSSWIQRMRTRGCEQTYEFSHTDPPDIWLDPARSICIEIPLDGEAGIVLNSFHAG